ncbi:MAG: hypothetical protein CL752_06060 [Chloroflexi bacterium]|nr:hypothetical protein [Chloroflexota bacterium]
MMPKFIVNDDCSRTGMCSYERPDLFEEGEDGYPIVLESGENIEMTDGEIEEVLMICPSGAILKATSNE